MGFKPAAAQNLDPALINLAQKLLGGGTPGVGDKILVRPAWEYYSKQAQAGQPSLTYFQASAPAIGTSNLEQPGTIRNDFLFECRALSFQMIPSAALVDETDDDAFEIAADMYFALLNGRVKFTYGDQTIVQALGLDGFPSGNGLQIDVGGAVGGSNTATTYSTAANINSGAPYQLNKRWFDHPLIMYPGRPFKVLAEWDTAVALPSGVTASLIARLHGNLYSPAGS